MSEQALDTDGTADDLGLEHGAPDDGGDTDDGLIDMDSDTGEVDYDALLEEEIVARTAAESQTDEERQAAEDEEVLAKAASKEEGKAKAEAPKSKREERVVVKLQEAQATIQELRTEVQALKAQPVKAKGVQPSGDLIGDILELTAQSHGMAVDDPRLAELLRSEVGAGLLAHLAGPNTQNVDLRRIQDRRQALREHLKVQAEIESMKGQTQTERQQLESQRQEAQARQLVSSEVAKFDLESEYPYLSAVSDDVTADVHQALEAMNRNGWQPRSPGDVADGIAYALKTLEDDRRTTAERLEKVRTGQKSAGSPTSPPETRGTRRDGSVQKNATGRRGEERARTDRKGSVTASGPGDRKPPAPQAESDEDLLDSMLREELAERRRNAAQRTRR